MGDDQRRERRTFEPPPWEREAFEALAAKRAERGAEGVAVVEAAEADPAPVAEVAGAELGAAAANPADVAVKAERQAPSDKAVAAMMLELSRHEANDGSGTKIVAWVASGVTAVLGLTMATAGVALATRAAGKASALLGSGVLTLFGLVFLGMAVWVWISTNRVRGR